MKRACKRAVLLFAVIVLVLTTNIALLGGFHFADSVDASGRISDCLLKNIVPICPVNPLEHIAEWQAVVATIVKTIFAVPLWLLALFPFALAVARHHRRQAGAYIDAYRMIRTHLSGQASSVSSPLQIALARGILHPKLF